MSTTARTLTVVVLVTFLAGCTSSSAEGPPPSSTPTPVAVAAIINVIPDVVGLDGQDAAVRLAELDMQATFIDMATGKDLAGPDGGDVLQTYPAAGEDVHSNRSVSLFLGPAPDALPVATEALTAQQVVDAFKAAGLPVTDARDNTTVNCAERGCNQMITTEDITVLSFSDDAAATTYVNTWGSDSPYRLGSIVLSYAAARTPLEARPLYEAALGALEP